MNYETLLISIENNICKLVINRPKQLNALNTKVFAELDKALDSALDNNEVKTILITGVGEKAFAAGADIKEFEAFTPSEGKKLAANGQHIFQKIEEASKPVLAAVNGFALGGGCELAMACHLRIASENARFGQPEITLGVTPGYAGTQRLPRYIGRAKATELLLTGEMIKAQEALTLGLVNYVVPQDQLMDKANEVLGKIMKQSSSAARGILKAVDAYYNKNTDGFMIEIEEFGKCFETSDFIEGTTAFKERRKPNFK